MFPYLKSNTHLSREKNEQKKTIHLDGQEQVKLLTASKQVPPFKHGELAHSFTST